MCHGGFAFCLGSFVIQIRKGATLQIPCPGLHHRTFTVASTLGNSFLHIGVLCIFVGSWDYHYYSVFSSNTFSLTATFFPSALYLASYILELHRQICLKWSPLPINISFYFLHVIFIASNVSYSVCFCSSRRMYDPCCRHTIRHLHCCFPAHRAALTS